MTEQSNGNLSPRTIWLLIAVAVAAMIGVFASMATSLAIRERRVSAPCGGGIRVLRIEIVPGIAGVIHHD
jgi:hypothetical protein